MIGDHLCRDGSLGLGGLPVVSRSALRGVLRVPSAAALSRSAVQRASAGPSFSIVSFQSAHVRPERVEIDDETLATRHPCDHAFPGAESLHVPSIAPSSKISKLRIAGSAIQ